MDNPQAAAEGLREYGVNMETPAWEPDLESTLQPAGQHMARSRRRTSAGEQVSGVKTSLDSPDRHERAKDWKGMSGTPCWHRNLFWNKQMTEPHGSQIFSRSDNMENQMYDFEYDVDPQSHVFYHISDTCKYYTDDQLKDNV